MERELSHKIPKELLDWIKKEGTNIKIAEICLENEIEEEEKIRAISYQIGRVLFGDLPPRDFEKELRKRLELSSFSASKIAREISESIFYPVKENLAILYGNEAITFQEQPINYPETTEEKPGEKDTYRESVE